ncbi:nucleotidyltransferase domain-containing protein [Paenibacillus eucommiae]|uniref:Polymerase nucleotidyl transferase domain-containing protein n=1 Tax=Paenibacillus eucommiae TaxID=1355755 RepID=A0ABS4J9K9_9BACL|nr:nucleotidyltransferase domain-containing protein [Paenibacillus eucommiae]MBP1996527.1 hypothetical protein [Paenibacillus eucommiae]
MPEKWELALEHFLADWKERNEVIGAMVCGSYITGSPSVRSDIDVHIILSDHVDWRERGNRIYSGYLIEYFANPAKQIRDYFKKDFHDSSTMSMVQFLTGKILFDKTGVINELKLEAAQWKLKAREGLNDSMMELKKYGLWDDLDNLQDCYEQQRIDFHFLYYHSLFRLFTTYCAYLKLEKIPYYQISSYLLDSTYLNK